MEYLEYRVKFKSRRDVFRLYPLGCIHVGTIHCAEGEIKRKVKDIDEDPFALWIGMGDYGEFIAPNDKRWDASVQAEWVKKEPSNVAESQRKWVRDLLKPIASKCVGLLKGNHEESIRLHNIQDVYLDLCRDLGVPRLEYSAFVRFIFSRGSDGHHSHTFMGVFQHGSGGAQTEGGKVMRLKKFMDSFEADIYGMGHLHDIITDHIVQLGVDGAGKIQQKVKAGAITGCWFKSYTQGVPPSYAEEKGYTPTMVGCPHWVIIPDKNQVRVTI